MKERGKQSGTWSFWVSVPAKAFTLPGNTVTSIYNAFSKIIFYTYWIDFWYSPSRWYAVTPTTSKLLMNRGLRSQNLSHMLVCSCFFVQGNHWGSLQRGEVVLGVQGACRISHQEPTSLMACRYWEGFEQGNSQEKEEEKWQLKAVTAEEH